MFLSYVPSSPSFSIIVSKKQTFDRNNNKGAFYGTFFFLNLKFCVLLSKSRKRETLNNFLNFKVKNDRWKIASYVSLHLLWSLLSFLRTFLLNRSWWQFVMTIDKHCNGSRKVSTKFATKLFMNLNFKRECEIRPQKRIESKETKK